MKRLVAFDLDGTLAESKQAIQPDMAGQLQALLGVADVAVISGGDWPQFQKQVVERLPDGSDLARLWIMPTTGTKLYRFQNGAWSQVYADLFGDDERAKIKDALFKAVDQAGFKADRIWGEQIEDRGSQITFSALGQEAPIDAKKDWDTDQAKRRKIADLLAPVLPGLSIKFGGTTSIDITREGVDKAYGMKRLCEVSGFEWQDILFMGDAIYPGGNDDPVRAAGIDSIKVRDPAETMTAIAAVVACLRG